MGKVILQAHSDKGFAFEFFIEKAITSEEDGVMVVEGVASTMNVDHDNERMAETALYSMAKIINESGVPLRWEHKKEEKAIIGNVNKAWVDGRNQLWIKATLDKSHPAAPMLYDKLKGGERWGLSVGGRVKNAVRELAEGAGQYVKTFYDVLLDEVSVTKRPANYDSWLVRKGVITKSMSETADNQMMKEFIFENHSGDYMFQFAKSIPEDSWVEKSELSTNKKEMDEKDKEKKQKAEDKEEEKEKSFVSKSDFEKFSAEVAKGFEGLGKMLKASLEVGAKDTTNPDKDKEEMIGDKQTAKAEGKAHDQNNPDKDKEENIGDGKMKSEADGSDENGEREKAEDDEDKEKSEDDEDKEKSDKEDEDKEKSEDDEDEKEKSDKEDMEDKEKAEDDEEDKKKSEVQKAIEVISAMAKEMKGQKSVRKSADKTEDVIGLDDFAKSLGEFADGIVERLEKNEKRIPGFAQYVADFIKRDPEAQLEIRKAMRDGSQKKSMVLGGTPFMTTKDGHRFQLMSKSASEEKVTKSADGKPVKFKDVWASDFSTPAEQE